MARGNETEVELIHRCYPVKSFFVKFKEDIDVSCAQGAQWRNGNAAASQQERSGFDSWKGHCGHCVMCPLLHVIGAHTLAGVGDRAFLCGVR